MHTLLRSASTFGVISGLVGWSPQASAQWCESYEASFLYLNDYPSEREFAWSHECQGLTNDADHWFITTKDRLWKIPLEHDLNENPGPESLDVPIPQPLRDQGYNHFGDLDYFQYGDRGYLAIPIEDLPHKPRRAVIAFFKVEDLSPIGESFWAPVHPDQGGTAGWVAFDSQGLVYSSDGGPVLWVYSVDWPGVADGAVDSFDDPPPQPRLLRDENGALLPLDLSCGQGGDFSPSDSLFYLVGGSEEEPVGTHQGINVFDTSNWNRVKHSSRSDMPFKYEWHPGGCTHEEPEGLSVWNLHDLRAPHAFGELHVLMLDNDDYGCDWPDNTDDIYLKHYTSLISVDSTYLGTTNYGRPWAPYKTVGEAYGAAWDGSRLRVCAGRYPEALTFSKCVAVLSAEGTAIIGSQGRLGIFPDGVVRIGDGGALRLH